ncbi:MAG: hypothetical protein AAGI30_04295 [Planctomycetota bacterium]
MLFLSGTTFGDQLMKKIHVKKSRILILAALSCAAAPGIVFAGADDDDDPSLPCFTNEDRGTICDIVGIEFSPDACNCAFETDIVNPNVIAAKRVASGLATTAETQITCVKQWFNEDPETGFCDNPCTITSHPRTVPVASGDPCQ